jgi:Holliday junction resolvase RusA-like endonuclease
VATQIVFPIEFIVHGTPVSLQAKRPESREEWKGRVRAASRTAIPDYHFASDERMAVTLFYLPDEPMQGDIDNIVKPILDSLRQHIYIDDVQVERVVVQKFEPGNVFIFQRPTDTFVRALTGTKPVLYIRVSNDPTEELL